MNIALIGATGMVGREMLRQLEKLPQTFSVTLFASQKSAGATLTYKNQSLTVQPLPEKWPDGFNYALMSAGGALSRSYGPKVAQSGTTLIDNSSAWRRHPEVPLVVPEINGHKLKGYQGIIANPNCSTIQMALALQPLRTHFGVKKVIVSTYQAVSGAGMNGANALINEEQERACNTPFPSQIHRNVIPQIGDFNHLGFTEEEDKLMFEPTKIFDDPNLEVMATAVRVPVLHGHSESLWVELERPATQQQIIQAFEQGENLKWEPSLVTPQTHCDSDLTYVSRLRCPKPTEVMFWCVAHNLRVGAATNACRILSHHLAQNC